MRQKKQETCPHCGKALTPAAANEPEVHPPAPEPERDRRGVPLPARSKVGGIITPQ